MPNMKSLTYGSKVILKIKLTTDRQDPIYTHRQKLSNTTFFRRHCFGSCRTEYVGNGNQIFLILLQILLLL